MKKAQLRIAFIIDTIKVEKWKHRVINTIENASYLKDFVVLNLSDKNEKIESSFSLNKKSFWYDQYLRLDNRLFRPNPNADELVALDKNYLSEFIQYPYDQKDYTSLQDRLRKMELDVIINLSNRNIDFSVLNMSKYGMWHLKLADNIHHLKKYDGINEIIKKKVTLDSHLIGRNSDNKEYLLFSTKSFVDYLSISRTKNAHLWKNSLFITRKLAELYRLGNNFYDLQPILADKELETKIHALPSLSHLLGHTLKTSLKLLSKKITNRYRFQQWILLFKFTDDFFINEHLESYIRIKPPKDRIWADPFPYVKDGRYYIFIEEMLFSDNKGFISVMELYKDGTFSKPKKIIENDYHMSYPFLFEHENNLYMIPETGSNKTIELYKCSEFPYQWKYEKVLKKGVKAVDTTFFEDNGKFWIFTNEKQTEGVSAHEELFLYFTDDLINGKWKSHPKNPIVSDVSCARSAGKIFREKNQIYRPAQNCTHHYGYGLKFQEILVLTEEEYQERTIVVKNPNSTRGIISVHTYNKAAKLNLLDAQIIRNK